MSDIIAAPTRTPVVDAIVESLAEVLNQDLENVSEQTELFTELGLDSTGILDLLMALEDRLGIEFDGDQLEMGHFSTVGSLADFVESLLPS